MRQQKAPTVPGLLLSSKWFLRRPDNGKDKYRDPSPSTTLRVRMTTSVVVRLSSAYEDLILPSASILAG